MLGTSTSDEHFHTVMFGDIPVLRRRWQAALSPGDRLPHYEDVMLGSLGRLADHLAVLLSDHDTFQLTCSGRFVAQWLDDDRGGIPLHDLHPDCAAALGEIAASALQYGCPMLDVARCRRSGALQTYDILALPTASRWGGTLIGAYVNKRAPLFNLREILADEGIGGRAMRCEPAPAAFACH